MKVKIVVRQITYVESELDASDYSSDNLYDQIEWYSSIKYNTSAVDIFSISQDSVINIENTFEVDSISISKD